MAREDGAKWFPFDKRDMRGRLTCRKLAIPSCERLRRGQVIAIVTVFDIKGIDRYIEQHSPKVPELLPVDMNGRVAGLRLSRHLVPLEEVDGHMTAAVGVEGVLVRMKPPSDVLL